MYLVISAFLFIRKVPEVNLATPRLGCKLISGEWGNYPFFFVDNGFGVGDAPPGGGIGFDGPQQPTTPMAASARWRGAATNQQPPPGPPLRMHSHQQQQQRLHSHHHQSRSVWDAESGGREHTTFEREIALRGRGDALANASAWGFMDSMAVSTAASGSFLFLIHSVDVLFSFWDVDNS